MKVAAAYLRRSTDDKQADSIVIQKEEVTRYAAENDYQIVTWYVDDGISGHDEERSDFVRMISDCEQAKNFDYILVRHQSRFGRFRPATTISYLDRIDRHGVRLVTCNRGIIDIDNLAEYLMASIEAETDHKFSKTLSELTIRGQVQTAKSGRSAGQQAPYGMDRVLVNEAGIHQQRVRNGEKFAKPDSWSVSFVPSEDPIRVDTVRWIFETYAHAGRGYHAIATELNRRGIPSATGGKWHQGTIRDMLKNEIYCGDFAWNKRRQGKFYSRVGGTTRTRPNDQSSAAAKRVANPRRKNAVVLNDESDWIVVLNSHEGIISRELWQKAQEIMSNRKNRPGKPVAESHAYLLRGLVVCSECGEKMHGAKRTRRKGGKEYINYRYVCSGYSCKGICKHNAVSTDDLHPTIVSEVLRKFESEETIECIRREIAKSNTIDAPERSREVERLRRELKSTSNKLRTVTQRVGVVPDSILQSVFDEMAELTKRRDCLEAKLEEAKKATEREAQSENLSPAVIKAALSRFASEIRSCPAEKLSKLLASMIDRVELRFREVPYGKRTIRRLSGGKIHLRKSSEFLVAGARFELTTSRL